jgi:hypothetical protein
MLGAAVTPYKNRPHLEPHNELRRYIPLVALEDILRRRRLRLTRIDQFKDDPFEGSVPKQQIDDQVPIFSSSNAGLMEQVAAYYPDMPRPRRSHLDPFAKMAIRRQVKRRSAHASCWAGGAESDVMWRAYGNDDDVRGQCVALRTTLGQLETSVATHSLIVSPVTYRDYETGPAFNDELDAFMHKRTGYRHEEEVRFLRYNEQHYLALASALIGDDGFGTPPPAPPELEPHIYLDWSLAAVVNAITISPHATKDYEGRVKAMVTCADPTVAKLIELSVLSERRSTAYF